MKLMNWIDRQPLLVSFGRAGSGSTSLSIIRDADSAAWIIDSGASAELLAADTANAGVMTAADRQTLNALAQCSLQSLGDLAAATIDPAIQTIRVAGYAAAGDGGGGLWRQVAAEPAHLMKAQSANGLWFEIVLEGVALNVKAAGATGDGVTDDKPAIDRAASLTGNLAFPAGVYRVTGELVPPNHPIHWQGIGGDVTRAGAVNPYSVTLLADHDAAAILRIAPAVLAESEAMWLRGLEFRSTSTLADRHGIVMDGRSHWTELKDLTFSDITGHAIAFDPTRTPYCQNMALRDVSFFNCGGSMGLTAEPAPGAAYLAITLLELSNINIDHQINPISPQRFIWDWRAIREVNATTFLCEGGNGGAPTTEAVIGLAADSFNSLRNVHLEFTASVPEFFVKHVDDPDGRFFGAAESHTLVEQMVGQARFGFEAAVEADVRVNGWTYYNAASSDDIARFDGTGGSLRIDALAVKNPFSVPMALRGQCEIASVKSADIFMPFLHRGPARLARWRATDSSPITGADTGYFSFTNFAGSIASEAVESDGRLLVYRATSPAGQTPELRFDMFLDPSWLGSYVTAVCRYKFTADAADLGVDFRGVYTDSGLGAESGTQLRIDGGGVGTGDGAWRTGVVSFRPLNATPRILTAHLGTAPTQPVELRIAAFDLFLGGDWAEPLDIPS